MKRHPHPNETNSWLVSHFWNKMGKDITRLAFVNLLVQTDARVMWAMIVNWNCLPMHKFGNDGGHIDEEKGVPS